MIWLADRLRALGWQVCLTTLRAGLLVAWTAGRRTHLWAKMVDGELLACEQSSRPGRTDSYLVLRGVRQIGAHVREMELDLEAMRAVEDVADRLDAFEDWNEDMGGA